VGAAPPTGAAKATPRKNEEKEGGRKKGKKQGQRYRGDRRLSPVDLIQATKTGNKKRVSQGLAMFRE